MSKNRTWYTAQETFLDQKVEKPLSGNQSKYFLMDSCQVVPSLKI